MADSVLSWQAYGLTQVALAAVGQGTKPMRGDDLLNGGAACYQVYATADGGFISLGAIEEVFWCNFCQALGRVDWIARQTETMPQTLLIAEVSGVIASEPREYWDRILGAVDCCYHPVLDYTEVASWAQVKSRQLLDGEGKLRFAAWVEGAPPSDRLPMREVDLDEALTTWRDVG